MHRDDEIDCTHTHFSGSNISPDPATAGRSSVAATDARSPGNKLSTLWRSQNQYAAYPKPWAGQLTRQDRELLASTPWAKQDWFGPGRTAAVLVVDMYVAAAGPRDVPLLTAVETHPAACGPAAWRAVPVIRDLLAAARSRAVPVIHATGLPDGYSPWNPKKRRHDTTRSAQPDGAWDFIPECAPIDDEIVLRKGTPSAFASTPLRTVLRDLDCDTVVVVGEATSGCVRSTVVDGRCEGFAMAVVEDGTFDRLESSHAQALFDLDQKYADVLTSADVTDYLGLAPCVS